jgi:hypothetical protein
MCVYGCSQENQFSEGLSLFCCLHVCFSCCAARCELLISPKAHPHPTALGRRTPVPELQPVQEGVLAVGDGAAGATGDKAVPATAKGGEQQVGPDACALQLVM